MFREIETGLEKGYEDDQELEIKSYKEKLKGLDMVTLEKK